MRTSKIFVTVDAVVFRKSNAGNELLLIKRKKEPFKGKWALPGGFVDEGEDLAVAAKRELQEETGLVLDNLEQLGAFGKPGRDPRSHTVSIAYSGFAEADAQAIGADDADEAEWFAVSALPELAFDHADIIQLALEKHHL
ncbi:NUDIX domain-containing protein [Flavobacterium sp. AG291]|uniref:NUDIX domain-containing protein n=1 Tax=Flavobacterium sp. AG291 TaxID=2184000 RepID=UPI000E0ADEC0|nr:NUDIX hydrolase [Flavobacterium sp. AG291]RDI14314.1 8-oxo-dGTP diphosphatase [Flavobacterium sp. AG291]